MSVRATFEMELSRLHEMLKSMGIQVETAINTMFDSLKDGGDTQIAASIVKNDRFINDMQRGIESKCLSIITRQQPLAGDLRMISAILKVVTDIERIGDHAADIAELVIRMRKQMDEQNITLQDPVFQQLLSQLYEMMNTTSGMVHDAIESLINRNTELASQIDVRDDEVDSQFNDIKNQVVELIRSDVVHTDMYVDFLLLAKYLERMADHAVNISEWELFQETGSIHNVRIL